MKALRSASLAVSRLRFDVLLSPFARVGSALSPSPGGGAESLLRDFHSGRSGARALPGLIRSASPGRSLLPASLASPAPSYRPLSVPCAQPSRPAGSKLRCQVPAGFERTQMPGSAPRVAHGTAHTHSGGTRGRRRASRNRAGTHTASARGLAGPPPSGADPRLCSEAHAS